MAGGSGPGSTLEDWSVLHGVEPSADWTQALEFGLRGLELVPGSNLQLSQTTATIEGRLASQGELDRVRALLEPAPAAVSDAELQGDRAATSQGAVSV